MRKTAVSGIAITLGLGVLWTGTVRAQDDIPTGMEVLDHMTEVLTPVNSSGIMRQTITTSTGQKRTFELESFSANKGEKSLMRYQKPASVRGQAFLMLNNADDIWTYFPRTNRVRKLASHAKKQKVQGSDFTYEDMGSGDSWKKEYNPVNLGEEKYEGQKCWKLQCTAVPEEEPSYSQIMIWVQQDNYHPLRIDYYEEDELLKSLYMYDIQEVDGYPTATRMIMRNHQEATETSMEIISVSYSWEPPAGFFSERNLKK
ncbi:MAG: outer membrane lipoprotein-sorting protein [Candidatus Neomarinimicrobiota bacterium]